MYRNLSLLLAVALTMGLQSCYHDPRPEIRTDKTCSNDRFLYVKGDRVLALPTAFTPNGDGINDLFRPIALHLNPDSFSVRVLDPAGKEVYRYTAGQPSWTVTDQALLDIYQYYVDITVLDPEQGKISSCAPLFLLNYSNVSCIPVTHPEDKDRYVFEDQFDVRDWSLLMTNEHFCPR